jgi:hypothetical protein
MSATVLRPQEIERRRAALERHLAKLASPHAALNVGTFEIVAAKLPAEDDSQPLTKTENQAETTGFMPGVFCVVSYGFARKSAEENGILARRQALDLRAANALRKERGLPAFALKGEC